MLFTLKLFFFYILVASIKESLSINSGSEQDGFTPGYRFVLGNWHFLTPLKRYTLLVYYWTIWENITTVNSIKYGTTCNNKRFSFHRLIIHEIGMICHLRVFMYQQYLYVFICSLFHPFMLSIKSSRTCIKKKKVSDRYVLSFVLVHLDKIHLMFKFHFCYLQRNKIHETETCIWICSIFLVKNRNNGNWNAKISQLEYLAQFLQCYHRSNLKSFALQNPSILFILFLSVY